MCRDLLYSVGGGQPVSNGIQGMGYGILPMMAGVAELVGRGIVAVIAAGKRSYVAYVCKSDRLDFCGGASDRDVLLYYEA